MSIEIDYIPRTGRFNIKLPFAENGLVHKLAGRRWHKQARVWSAPAIAINCRVLQPFVDTAMANATPAALAAFAENTARAKKLAAAPPAVSLDWYVGKTEPYAKQAVGLRRIYGRDEFGLFMDMGTGKTKVSIDLFSIYCIEGKINSLVVVCPASIQDNWAREIGVHCPLGETVIWVHHQTTMAGKAQQRKFDAFVSSPGKFRIAIFSVESLSAGGAHKFVERVLLASTAMMVVDESGRIKNHKANRTDMVISLGKLAKVRGILSGTPISQGPLDLFAQFEFLNTHIFGIGDFYSFRNRFAVMGGYEGKEVLGYQNLDELVETIRPFVYQVRKHEMLDLPPKIHEVRYLELSAEQRKLLRDLAKGVAVVNDVEISVKNVLEGMLRMQQVCDGFYTEYYIDEKNRRKKLADKPIPGPNPKMAELDQLVSELPGQVLIFCDFLWTNELVHGIVSQYGPSVRFYGDMEENRQEVVNDFQAGKYKFLVAITSVGGIGLTLTAAETVLFITSSFDYSDRIQAEDRPHRIGLKHSVTYVDFIFPNTVDQMKAEAREAKMNVSEYVRQRISAGESPRSLLESLVG